MRSSTFNLVIAGALFLGFIGVNSLFVVNEGNVGIVTRFGKVVRTSDSELSVAKPGLHFKIPFIDKVKILDARIQTLSARADRFVTAEKKDLIIDSYVKWRISDPSTFYLTTAGGNTMQAEELLRRRINNSLRSQIGRLTIHEIVSGQEKPGSYGEYNASLINAKASKAVQEANSKNALSATNGVALNADGTPATDNAPNQESSFDKVVSSNELGSSLSLNQNSELNNDNDTLSLESDKLSQSANNASESSESIIYNSKRDQVMQNALRDLGSSSSELGIEIVDVRIKQINLPPEVSNSIYQRMRAERDAVAKLHRSQGRREAETIKAQADREVAVKIATAEREARRLMGEGDAEATRIYAEAYSQNPELFDFLRSMDAYRKSMANGNDVLVLKPDSEFFRYFSDPNSISRTP